MFKSNFIHQISLKAFLLSLLVSTQAYGIFTSLPKIDLSHIYAQEHNFKIAMQAFTPEECVAFFKKNLIDYGCRPIIMHIENTTCDTHVLSASSFRSPINHKPITLIPLQEVTPILQFKTLIFTATSAFVAWATVPPILPITLAISIGMARHNKSLAAFLEKHVFDGESELKIAPYQTIKKLLFLPELEFTSNIEMNLFNKQTKELITFQIDLFPNVLHLPHVMVV